MLGDHSLLVPHVIAEVRVDALGYAVAGGWDLRAVVVRGGLRGGTNPPVEGAQKSAKKVRQRQVQRPSSLSEWLESRAVFPLDRPGEMQGSDSDSEASPAAL